MLGTITIDITQAGHVILNARRNKPYAHQHKRLDRHQFGDIHAFVSHYIEAIQDESLKWDIG